jgi:acyl-CoA thioesterase
MRRGGDSEAGVGMGDGQEGAAARAMFARDVASRAMGMELLEAREGYARVAMRVREDMIQGHATCHGGYVFALADSAFAFACNSHGFAAVAAGCSIEYLAPAGVDEELTAEARAVERTGGGGVYDVAVRNGEGRTVALFRGRSRRAPAPRPVAGI